MSMQDDESPRDDSEHGARVFSSPETFCAEVEAYIIEKPFHALGMALLAGIVVGKIIL